jgi:hypothetical protein
MGEGIEAGDHEGKHEQQDAGRNLQIQQSGREVAREGGAS